MRTLRRRPSPATCIALLALFISLSGTTYAVTKLPKRSVGPAQLKAKAVTERKIANGAVVSSKLATGAVTTPKIAPGAVDGSRIAPNSIGADQIDEAGLPAIPLAQTAARAQVAARAETADRVEHVDRADTAGIADSATLADRATAADRADVADLADLASFAGGLDEQAVQIEVFTGQVPEGGTAGGALPCAAGPGLVPINGGYLQTSDDGDPLFLTGSFPSVDPNNPADRGWFIRLVDIDDDATGPAEFLAFSLCVKTNESP